MEINKCFKIQHPFVSLHDDDLSTISNNLFQMDNTSMK